MADAEFYNERAASLPPDEAVLFILNYENNTNINRHEVDISEPLAKDTEGRVKVLIRGKGSVRPTNYGGFTGEFPFYYRRTPLNAIGLKSDGSFYEGMNEVSFISIVEQLKRLTGINCSIADFVQTPFDATAPYVLKAAVKSWRFEGEVNLGRPQRTDLDTGLPIPENQLPLSLYEHREHLSKLITGMYTSLDLTSWPTIINRLKVGYKVKVTDTDLVAALNGQAGKGRITFTNGALINQSLNIYNATVLYNGLLRPSDPLGYLDEHNAVIVLKPDPNYVDGAIGNLYIHYIKDAEVAYNTSAYSAVMLNGMGTAQSGFGEEAFWASLEVGSLLSEAEDRTSLYRAFQKAFGLPYELRYGQAMRVTYNGPVRVIDPLPGDDANINVVAIEAVPVVNGAVRGSTRVYYN